MKTTLTLLTASILLILCALSTSCTKTFEDVWRYSEGTFPIQENGKWGFVDIRGKYIIKPQYDLVNGFLDGVASVTKDGKTGVIRKDGSIFLPLEYDLGTHYDSAGFFIFPIDQQSKWGIMKEDGTILVPAIFDKIYSFEGDYATVSYQNKWGMINREGDFFIPPLYDSPISFDDNEQAQVRLRHLVGYIKKDGSYLVEPQFWSVFPDFSEGLAACAYRPNFNEVGYINLKGEVQIPFKYLSAGPFSEGLAAVRVYTDSVYKHFDKYGYIDKLENFVIAPQFTSAEPFSEGFAVVAQEYELKYGYIDRKGNYLIEPQFNEAKSFINGLAKVRIDKKWGLLRKDGTYLAEPQFDEIGTVAHNRPGCFVQKDGKWGLLDKVTGKYLVKPKFSEVRSVACDYCFGNYPEYINVKENGRWRFIDIYGNDMSWL